MAIARLPADYDGSPDGQALEIELKEPWIAALLAWLVPGLGHIYAGQLGAGLLWFLAASFGYWAILVPGFAIHVASVYFAYQAAKEFRGY